MIKLLKIDKDGYLQFGQDKYIDINAEIPEGYTNILLPTDDEGVQLPFYKPQLVDGEWKETITQEELEAIKNHPKELSMEEQLALAIAELDAQRERDKTAIQLAITELATMLLGGE